MVVVRKNSFDSIWAPGTTITPQSSGNSGGPAGDPFNAVFAAGDNTIQFFNTIVMHGTQSARIVGAGGSSATLGYDDSTGEHARIYTRAYFRLASFHTGTLFIQHARSAASGLSGYSVRVSPEGYPQMYQRNGAQVLAQAENPINLNTWYRVEAMFDRTGAWALRVYQGDSYVPQSPEMSGTGADTNMSTGFQFIRWGIEASSGMSLISYWDELAYGTDWLGPVPGGASSAVSVVSNDGWVVQGTSSVIDSLSDNTDGTFMRSPVTSSTHHPLRFRIGPLGPGDVEIILRLAGDDGPSVRVRLYEGTRLVKTWNKVITSTPTDHVFGLTIAEMESITDRGALSVEVSGVN